MYISTLMRITIFQNKLDQVSSKVKRLVSQKPKCIWGATKQNKWPKQDGQKRQMKTFVSFDLPMFSLGGYLRYSRTRRAH
jgi:hypothetical protein